MKSKIEYSPRIIRQIDIPDNVAEYIEAHDGINLNVNINNSDGDYGYAHMTWYSVSISRITRTCQRCGYDPLWKPNDDDSKCLRHRYGSWRYDRVFVWSPYNNELGLEDAFNVWLESQSNAEAVKYMKFGQIGF